MESEHEIPSIGVGADDFWRAWLGDRPFFARMCGRWLSGDAFEIEDVLSLGALKALHFVQSNPSAVRRFRPWALRILYNLCVDRIRARGRALVLYSEDDAQEVDAPQRPAMSVPDHEVFRAELGEALARAIDALPQRLRETFELRFLEALPYEEISERLAISQDNARKRVQQARAFLRRELGVFA